MSPLHELLERLEAIRAEARLGATAETFGKYEALWRSAREHGAKDVCTRVLRDLATLTSELDPKTAALLAKAAGPVAPGATDAAVGADGNGVVDVSVVVLAMPGSATAAPVLASLDRQTLPRARFETILAERADGRSVNEAVAAARGRLIVFAAPDVTLAQDALARHVQAHAQTQANAQPNAQSNGSAAVVLGGLEREGLNLRPLAWSLERLGLLGCQHAAEAGGEVPAECLDFEHASLPREVFERAGGCDPALTSFSGAELAFRLAKLAGGPVACRLEPQIRASRPVAIDLDGWLEKARALGADWLALRRKHGAAAPPRWLAEVGIEESATETLFARQLSAAGGQQHRVDSLRESLREVEQILARDPARADSMLAKVGDDLATLVLEVTRHELERGFVNAALGGQSALLERCTAQTRRGAAVIVWGNASTQVAVSTTLAHLPADGELVVAIPAGTAAPELPDDSRLRRLALPKANTGAAGTLRRSLLGATGADYFVLLDGTTIPTRADWDALRVTLASLPSVGACTVDGESGTIAKATRCASLPSALVATRRDVVESDSDETDPFLERLVRRGYRLATATAAAASASSASPAEPAACSV